MFFYKNIYEFIRIQLSNKIRLTVTSPAPTCTLKLSNKILDDVLVFRNYAQLKSVKTRLKCYDLSIIT